MISLFIQVTFLDVKNQLSHLLQSCCFDNLIFHQKKRTNLKNSLRNGNTSFTWWLYFLLQTFSLSNALIYKDIESWKKRGIYYLFSRLTIKWGKMQDFSKVAFFYYRSCSRISGTTRPSGSKSWWKIDVRVCDFQFKSSRHNSMGCG